MRVRYAGPPPPISGESPTSSVYIATAAGVDEVQVLLGAAPHQRVTGDEGAGWVDLQVRLAPSGSHGVRASSGSGAAT